MPVLTKSAVLGATITGMKNNACKTVERAYELGYQEGYAAAERDFAARIAESFKVKRPKTKR